jgi:hypothetical protein
MLAGVPMQQQSHDLRRDSPQVTQPCEPVCHAPNVVAHSPDLSLVGVLPLLLPPVHSARQTDPNSGANSVVEDQMDSFC